MGAAALAAWPLISAGVVIALSVLLVGSPIERMIRDRARAALAKTNRRDMQERP
ncbi:hypothetical protein [Sphingomonas bacterium]|uniref:hypothetical protein n=1 Tax=Sphingomonas bacterium TaxID=1895847 RepID=UPI001575E2A1|nr:hypothetical protein [Sphingomonas bacterium]